MSEKELIEIIGREVKKYFSSKNSEESSPMKKLIFLGEDELLKNHLEKSFLLNESEGEKIILSTLSLKNLINLSMGNYSDEYEKSILEFLLQGKEIYVVREGLEYLKYPQGPSKLLNKYINSLKELENFGVKVFKRENIIDELLNTSIYYSEKVLNVNTLRKISKEKIYVSKETLITDLGKEYIRENNISVIKG
ncbi:ethanolamine utilization protein [Cetobacterium ceti]|uniref:Ethanolamine utilization protein n=1 Tax=Cetobacterium ceti TaxID=180163 RepID=A0A1T4MBZ7_9FUSO|nr:hypothetical protein [Cetobacterium ceti]SJZ64569.1 ethanolamine utilization protein [Cetobacterium ceti]